MSWYLFVKWLHILSATILFGTGIGIAFFLPGAVPALVVLVRGIQDGKVADALIASISAAVAR